MRKLLAIMLVILASLAFRYIGEYGGGGAIFGKYVAVFPSDLSTYSKIEGQRITLVPTVEVDNIPYKVSSPLYISDRMDFTGNVEGLFSFYETIIVRDDWMKISLSITNTGSSTKTFYISFSFASSNPIRYVNNSLILLDKYGRGIVVWFPKTLFNGTGTLGKTYTIQLPAQLEAGGKEDLDIIIYPVNVKENASEIFMGDPLFDYDGPLLQGNISSWQKQTCLLFSPALNDVKKVLTNVDMAVAAEYTLESRGIPAKILLGKTEKGYVAMVKYWEGGWKEFIPCNATFSNPIYEEPPGNVFIGKNITMIATKIPSLTTTYQYLIILLIILLVSGGILWLVISNPQIIIKRMGEKKKIIAPTKIEGKYIVEKYSGNPGYDEILEWVKKNGVVDLKRMEKELGFSSAFLKSAITYLICEGYMRRIE